MKVPIYDLSRIISTVSGDVYCGMPQRNALLVGENKYILIDNDAVHTIHNKDDFISFRNPVSREIVRINIDHFFAADKDDEMELGDFIRRFGSRIERNYAYLLLSILEIGLNPEDYPRDI